MENTPYTYIQLLSFICYLFLFFVNAAVKKNRLVYSFISILGCFILWSGGSLLMRIQMTPDYRFWYYVSLAGLFLVPLAMHEFVTEIMGAKNSRKIRIWNLLTIIVLGTMLTGIVLPPPDISFSELGEVIFQYNSIGFGLFIPVICFIPIIVDGVLVLVKAGKNQIAPWTMPICFGFVALVAGNLASIMPGVTFPWDTLAGIFNALCLLYALYKKQMFQMVLLTSSISMAAFAGILTFVTAIFLADPLYEQFKNSSGMGGNYVTVVVSLFVLLFAVLHLLLTKLLRQFMERFEQQYTRKLYEYSLNISALKDRGKIISMLTEALEDVIGVKIPHLFFRDKSGQCFVEYCKELDYQQRFVMKKDDPCVKWLSENSGCIQVNEFKKSSIFKHVTEERKNMLISDNVGCIMPLKTQNGELRGIILLTAKKRQRYTTDEINFINSVSQVTSIALDNILLYEQQKYEAQTDFLTGLLNRRYFYRKLDAILRDGSVRKISLVLFSIDDFHLFNQLYGNKEGDRALAKIGKIFQEFMDKKGYVARYSGKEFVLMFLNADENEACRLAEEVRAVIYKVKDTSLVASSRALTMSAGVAMWSGDPGEGETLLQKAEFALLDAKHSGKDCIKIYSEEKTMSGSGRYEEYADTIYALTAAIDAKDHFTFSHSQNVARYSVELAKAIGLSEEQVQVIYEAALLHDIGKIGIPEHILSKKTKLTDEEYAIIQKHVENSIAIIRHLPSLDYVIPAAVSHHERWDGRGYPRKIAGEDIPLSGRCLAIADSFDAITSKRSYHEPYPVEYAVEELKRGKGTQFDPNLVDIFIELIEQRKISVKNEV